MSENTVNIKSFHLYARIYDLTIENLVRSLRHTIGGFIKDFPVLDICCGTGGQLNYIRERAGERVVGLDLDERVLRYAQKKYNDIVFIRGDAGSLPFRTNTFGSVVISFALHDKPPVFRHNMIEEAHRVLKSGGHLVLVDFEKPWNCRSRLGGWFTHLIEMMAGGEHYRNGRQFLKAGGLKHFIKENNLKDIKSHRSAGGSLGIYIGRFNG